MSSSTLAQDTRSAQAADRRRQRRERAAKARTPEPKDIVSGAGQPLDPGVRRELEETLGHDLSRVRLHTDRDAAALTQLLGADAVAVGQEIFFREGAYQPGLAGGRRLLAHELLHTVQNPEGLGALRAGREVGAVSLPHDAAEREAEATARDLVRDEAAPETEPEEAATPGWLRYATVDADRMRAEQLDPVTLVDRLANGVLRSLRGDPADLSGRVRLQLARMSPELQDSVLGRLETRLFSFEYDRVLALVEEADRLPAGFQPSSVPAPVPDLAEERESERASLFRAADGDRQSEQRQAEDAREEKTETESRDQQQAVEQSAAERDAAAEKTETAERTEQEDELAQDRAAAEQGERKEEEKQAAERDATARADAEQAESRRDEAEQVTEARKEQRDREERDPEQANEPGAEKRRREDDEKKPADGSTPEDIDKKAEERPGPVRPEKVDEHAEDRDSPLTKHGLHEKDEEEGEPREEEKPLGLEAGADKEIGGDDGEPARGDAAGKGEPELKPEDYLPATDLDVSGVPTADQLTPEGAAPAMPTFPTPPPTKAERVEQQREDEADEEEDEDGPEEANAPGEERGPVEGEAPKPEGGPAAEAPDRTDKDLRPEKPLEQEIGPDPETTDKERREPEAEPKRDPEQQQDQEEDGAKAARRDEDDKDSDAGEEKPDAKDPQDEQQEKKEQAEQEEKRENKGQPAGAAADKPAAAPGPAATPGADSPAGAAALRPAGAHAEKTPAEDRDPSPAARRFAEPPKSQREAPAPKSQVPKETGPGAAPSGNVGGDESAGPTTAAGPGGAPSAAQAAVSPAGEQAAAPGAMGAPAPEGAKARPEASLEKDGGECAPPPPAPEKQEGKGCGGGGGGGGGEKKEKKPEPPNVSGQDPKAAVQTVSKLPPDQAQAVMPQVGQAADKKIGRSQRRLDANPPTRERPSGAPQTQSAPPRAAAPAAPVTGRVEKVGPAEQGEKQQAKGGEKAQGEKPTSDVSPPPLPAANAEISAENAESVEAAANAVPTIDRELRNKTVGPAPKIKLEGASDPKRTDDQAKKLKKKQAKIQSTGREDAAKPMGEDKIFPNAPRERLVGTAPRGGGKGGGPAITAGSPVEPGVGVVAQQEKGAALRSGAGQARTQMTAKEKEHQQDEQRAKRRKQTEIDREAAQNADKQTAERRRAAEQAGDERTKWRDEQDKKIADEDKKSEKEHTAQNKKIIKTRDDKDKEVEDKKNDDNKQIDDERVKAEKEAEKKKEEKKDEGGGFLGWLADKVKGFFEGLLKAVTAVFDAARKVVNGIIDKFKEFANQAIDFVRDLAIKAINDLADALIAIGDVLLAAFPELRDKFRKAIEGLRDEAIAAVNKLADGLKKAVNALLDALAAGLNALLSVLEGLVKGIIKAYQAVILGAIKFAQAAIAALAQFAELIADIAPDPGGWIAKAGSAMETGVTDHLWGAIKTAVKTWFDAKVEGILGLGKAVINVLIKGCLSMKQIAKMAWDAIIASLPMIIISLIIEKLISLIVPAAGAILTIVQGLMAAWQSISSILTAFSKFWQFLKAVKAGPAACLFAEAVAAGIVAVLDFIANFLMIRLGMATKGVGKRLKGMAQKIMKGLKKTGKGARKAAGDAVNRARAATRKAEQAIRKPPGPAKPKGPRVPGRSKTTADRTPGGTRRPPGRRDPDRPPSRTPDRTKQNRRDQDEAKRDRDKDRERATVPPRRPTDRAPDTRRPADRDAQRPGDRDEDAQRSRDRDRDGDDRARDTAPRRKANETTAPKRAKPRRPKSSAGRALGRAKRAVKNALTRIRNAAKSLGRKLGKKKLGRALKNAGNKLRNTFKRKRGRMRENQQRRKEQREKKRADKRKDEEKESKDARLAKIVARMRPRLESVLRRGVDRSIFNGTLGFLRNWYRLSGLSLKGSDELAVVAELNPIRDATAARKAVLKMLRKLPQDAREFVKAELGIHQSVRNYLFLEGLEVDPNLSPKKIRELHAEELQKRLSKVHETLQKYRRGRGEYQPTVEPKRSRGRTATPTDESIERRVGHETAKQIKMQQNLRQVPDVVSAREAAEQVVDKEREENFLSFSLPELEVSDDRDIRRAIVAINNRSRKLARTIQRVGGEHSAHQNIMAGAMSFRGKIRSHTSMRGGRYGAKFAFQADIHKILREILDSIPKEYQSRGHGSCAEIALISDALHEENVSSVEEAAAMFERDGTIITSHKALGFGGVAYTEACDSCKRILKVLKIRHVSDTG